MKRITKFVPGAHRNGAWKIAYADFVTAMMAFFLLMWLVGTTTSNNLRGIAEYFKTPLMVVLMGGKEDSDVDSIVTGGSNNPLDGSHQVKRGDAPPAKATMQDAKINLQLKEIERLQQLKRRLEEIIDTNPAMRKFKDQLLLDITSDGLRIQILDQQNRPMFNLGSAALQPYTADILHEIGKALNEVPNRISLSGHTDARPYQGGAKNYSNWDLSVDRANASRRELIAGGMEPGKILRVVGLASSALFNPVDPLDPNNRRISIIVMNSSAEKAASLEGGGLSLDDENTADAPPVATAPPAAETPTTTQPVSP